MKSIESRIENRKNTWFFEEPAYYIVSSMCKIQISAKTKTIMCGVHGIFINPDFASSISDDMLEDCLKCECNKATGIPQMVLPSLPEPHGSFSVYLFCQTA